MSGKYKSQQLGSLPEGLKPFVCHGITLKKPRGGSGDWCGDCPFCGKESHLYVNASTGQFDCKVCGQKGNAVTFMTHHAETIAAATTPDKLKELGESRGSTRIGRRQYAGQIPAKVLKSFGVGWDGDQWLIPSRGPKGTVRDLRRWHNGQVMATAGIKLVLGGLERIAKIPKTGTVWLCEGEFDAMAMQWLLTALGRTRTDCVAWVPGATVFKAEWTKELKGCRVVAVYDNDRAGDDGQELCYKRLNGVASSLQFVCWPDSKPKGYDLRDYVCRCMATDVDPQKAISELEQLLRPAPRRGVPDGARPPEDAQEPDEEMLEPATLEEVIETFKRFVLMNDEMELALKVMLAVCLSNEVKSDPLWLYLIGPPGAGKTLLLSSMQESKRCKFVSTITAHSLVSGWRMEGDKDPSLIPQLRGKTFVAKDFTEVLTLPPMVQDEIFSTLRGAYDGYVQRPFGNGIMREYKDCHFSMIAGVTNAVHGHQKASLGERFLKFQLNPPGKRQADEIVEAAIGSVGREKQMEEELQLVVRRFLAKRVDPANLPVVPKEYVTRLTALVQLIAVMRAQVSRDYRGEEVMFRPVPEAGTRLAKQLVKLGMMLAAVDDKSQIDEESFSVVQKVAYDTAYGFHLDVVGTMMSLGGSATKPELIAKADVPEQTLRKRLEDLMVLGAIRLSDFDKKPSKAGGRPARVYEVTDRVAELWSKAQGKDPAPIIPASTMPMARRRKKKVRA